MRVRKASAFAPAHITGFFEICDTSDNVLKIGSRGAGLCLELGATTRVRVRGVEDGGGLSLSGPRTPAWDIRIDGKDDRADVSRTVVHAMAHDMDVRVRTKLDMPAGQGLGMSGAGALGCAMALADVRDIPMTEAVAVAHEAEVVARTGLGDVGPQAFGGMTIRLSPGIPPLGKIRSIPVDPDREILVAVVGEPVSTRDTLSHEEKRRAIKRAGGESVEALSRNPTLENFFALSRDFAEESGLGTRRAMRVVRAVEHAGGLASVSMIGNSIFAMAEDLDRVVRAIKKHVERMYVCPVDNRGARLV